MFLFLLIIIGKYLSELLQKIWIWRKFEILCLQISKVIFLLALKKLKMRKIFIRSWITWLQIFRDRRQLNSSQSVSIFWLLGHMVALTQLGFQLLEANFPARLQYFGNIIIEHQIENFSQNRILILKWKWWV